MFQKVHYLWQGEDKRIKKDMRNDLKTEIKTNGGTSMATSYNDAKFKVFSLNSNRDLAKEIADHIGTSLGECTVTTFSVGEIQINIDRKSTRLKSSHVAISC